MAEFVDTNRDEFGVEPICTTLQVAPSTYYAYKRRLPSARALRDAVMGPLLLALWIANYRVYGAHKLWKAARRAGHDIGRDQVARLMRRLEIRGVSRSRRVRTTVVDEKADRPADLVERDFTADRPNRLWVTDLTFVSTWAGTAYVCFIIDAFSRRIVGWRVAAHMRTAMVLDALEMTRSSRGTRLEGLVAHSDAGSQGGFKWSSQHLSVEVFDGTAISVDGDVDGASGDAVAWQAACAPRCRARFLSEDCRGFVERERSDGVWCLGSGRFSLVPRSWWDAIDSTQSVVRQVSDVC